MHLQCDRTPVVIVVAFLILYYTTIIIDWKIIEREYIF